MIGVSPLAFLWDGFRRGFSFPMEFQTVKAELDNSPGKREVSPIGVFLDFIFKAIRKGYGQPGFSACFIHCFIIGILSYFFKIFIDKCIIMVNYNTYMEAL